MKQTVVAGAAALCAAILLGVGEARADWQYTKWGMTPEQVEAASSGLAKVAGPVVKGTYKSGDITFLTEFYFQNGGLHLISLKPDVQGYACFSLRQSLEAVYGKPFSVDGEGRQWHDPGKNNRVGLDVIGNYAAAHCDLVYAPLLTPDGGGL